LRAGCDRALRNEEEVLKITYKRSGVDIAGATEFKRKIKPLVRKSFRPEVLADIGGFGSFFRFAGKYRDPVLVSSADGVGTKLTIARLAGKHDTVGIDCVAMNVNDILCTGAEPLFFLDYLAYSRVRTGVLTDVVAGITKGCVESSCSLIGGETAQMPGMYADGEYDLAGFCVGSIDRKDIIDGSRIRPTDVVIGLASNGIHSNGYSLVRKVFKEREQVAMAKELLKPTRIYVRPMLDILYRQGLAANKGITGIAHITGGAFYDKIERILPPDVRCFIRKGSWQVPGIFSLIQKRGAVDDREMYHTLNMGIGMVVIVRRGVAPAVRKAFEKRKIRSWIIGEAIKGPRGVEVVY
jgi:phosphoribosylformylglycinamidine cyclo-ligase